MKLQLDDRHLENPLRVLEGVSITACGIKFIHTFAVVNFGKEIAYDIILGRPSMRQIRLIQNWGSNHLYLRHSNGMMRVSTINHYFKDVKQTLLEEYDLLTTLNSSLRALEQAKAHLWCV